MMQERSAEADGERSRRDITIAPWVAVFAMAVSGLHAQVPVPASGPAGNVRIHNTDLAVLEAGEDRKDLPCVVSPNKAFLGFDLRFHAGYDLSLPLRELSGKENLLTVLFRVSRDGERDRHQYFIQRIRVPSIEEEAKGDAQLQGGFDLGEGKYFVDLLVRDRAERVCAHSWDVEAELPGKDKPMSLVIPPGAIEGVQPGQFEREPPVERDSSATPLNVKVLINFAPQRANASTLRPLDTAALVSILRTLVREPRIGKFTVVAFNLQDQKVFYRQEAADSIDFPALGESLSSVSLGTVDLKRLSEKHGDRNFLADLIAKEVSPAAGMDAIIFAGPKTLVEENIPTDQLRQIGNIDYPVFYMNYNLNPQNNPWRDAIGHAVKVLKGFEYTISRPRDLWFAVTEMIGRVVESRNAKQLAAVSGK
jgi:hypothetical protein